MFSVHILIYYTLVLCCDRTSLLYITCSLPGYHCDTCGITVHPEKVSSETCYNNSMWCNNIRVYRAVASYVMTVNQLYISLLILDYLRYLPHLCGNKVVGCTMNSETRAAWNLSFYYVNYYSAIAQLSRWVNPMNIVQRSWVRHRLPFSCHWAQYFFAPRKCFVTCFHDVIATAL